MLSLCVNILENLDMVCLADSLRIADQPAGQSKAYEMVFAVYSKGANQGTLSLRILPISFKLAEHNLIVAKVAE